MAFGGTWTYELQASGSGSRVTITEDGEVYNPDFFNVARLHQPVRLDRNVSKALGKKYGEDVQLAP